MKFSCADFTFPLLAHADALRLIRMLGCEGVDLGVFDGRSHLQPKEIMADPEGAVRRVKAMLAETRLVVSDVFLQTGPEPPEHAANDPDPAVRAANREMFDAVLGFCAALGCRHMTGLPGVWHPGVDTADDWKLAVGETRWRVERAAERGIVYAIEAHVGSLCPDPESALRFAGEAGVTHTLDYGHFIYQGMSNEAAHALLPLASHFHARGGKPGGLQTTVAENEIDFPEIMRRFRESGYDGWICLEYVWVDWEGCNRTDNVSETILLRRLLEGC
jgi:sugar phosphate isomerase/epimerase